VIAYSGRFGVGVFGGKATSKPAPFANGAKGCGTRKIKGRAKTSQLQDELPEWIHRGCEEIEEGKPAAAGEKAAHPPLLPQAVATIALENHAPASQPSTGSAPV
jgi:hypothetical protein